MAFTKGDAHNEIRKLVAAVTATVADSGVAGDEALELLKPRTGTESQLELLLQYKLTIGGLLEIAAGMVTLAGELQSSWSAEELIQRLALMFEKRWAE